MHKYTWLLLVTCEIIRDNHLNISAVITSLRQFFFLGISSKTNLRCEKRLFFENSHSRRRRRALCRGRSHAAHMFSKMLTAGKAALKAEKHTEKVGFHLQLLDTGTWSAALRHERLLLTNLQGGYLFSVLKKRGGGCWKVCVRGKGAGERLL